MAKTARLTEERADLHGHEWVEYRVVAEDVAEPEDAELARVGGYTDETPAETLRAWAIGRATGKGYVVTEGAAAMASGDNP